jgi:HlyD family secretion protein
MKPVTIPAHSGLRIFLVLATLLLASCSKPWGGDGDAIQLSGTVEAREADLSFQVPGRIATIDADEGAAVKTGDSIASLDDTDYQLAYRRASAEDTAAGAAVVQARARLKYTRADLARISQLAQKSLVSPDQLEQAQLQNENAAADLDRAVAQVAVAHAALATAKRQLDYVKLTAPNPGVVSVRLAEVGEVVPAGKSVVRLAETARPWVRAYINEADLSRVRLGQQAKVQVDGVPGKVFTGRLSFIAPKAEFTPKTVETHALRVDLVYRVRVEVDNPEGILKIGMPADITLQAAPAS